MHADTAPIPEARAQILLSTTVHISRPPLVEAACPLTGVSRVGTALIVPTAQRRTVFQGQCLAMPAPDSSSLRASWVEGQRVVGSAATPRVARKSVTVVK